MRIRKLVSSAVALSVGMACGGGGDTVEPPAPDPGPVKLILSTPNVNDGALLVAVTGGTVSSVSAQGYQTASTVPGGGGVTLIIRGSIADGNVAQITLPDRKHLADYTATVKQAADRSSYQQQNLAGYSITLVP